VLVQDIREERGNRTHRHGSSSPYLVEAALNGHEPCNLLCISHTARGGHPDPFGDLVDLLCFLGGDKIPHGSPHLGRENDTSLEHQSDRGGSFQSFLVLLIHINTPKCSLNAIKMLKSA